MQMQQNAVNIIATRAIWVPVGDSRLLAMIDTQLKALSKLYNKRRMK